jgi:hypothetical protein
LPGWLDANETWCGVCQSCVITILLKPLAILLITGDDLVAVFHGQAAARQEAVLHVDDDQRACRIGFDLVGRGRAPN